MLAKTEAKNAYRSEGGPIGGGMARVHEGVLHLACWRATGGRESDICAREEGIPPMVARCGAAAGARLTWLGVRTGYLDRGLASTFLARLRVSSLCPYGVAYRRVVWNIHSEGTTLGGCNSTANKSSGCAAGGAIFLNQGFCVCTRVL